MKRFLGYSAAIIGILSFIDVLNRISIFFHLFLFNERFLFIFRIFDQILLVYILIFMIIYKINKKLLK
ncbi:hypothetical protein KHQ81_07080 [Mycoplasmatota bacterium]|nr:hypothetical protein KHQ81_07080 [Mycoplasmatota bacterium]